MVGLDTETDYGSLVVVLIIEVHIGQKTERRGHGPTQILVILMVGLDTQTAYGSLVLLITVVTAFIIMTISANLVLSLGMVGALSIVRFRSAIKDPLDVGFLFWGVGAGITAGAGLYFVAIIGTVFVAALYIILTLIKKERRCYLLVVRYGTDAESNVNALLGTLRYKLKNKTQINDRVELTIEIKSANNDTTQLSRFKAIDGVDSVTLLEYNGEYMN